MSFLPVVSLMALALLPTLGQDTVRPVADRAAADTVTLRVVVDVDPGARIATDSRWPPRAPVRFHASAVGGLLTLVGPPDQAARAFTTTTPALIEVRGAPRSLEFESLPDQPLRIRVLDGRPGAQQADYRAWRLVLERVGERYLPASRAFRVPPR